jgi:signal transduction histidine kinase
MQRLTLRIGFFLAVDIALLALCLLHVPHLLNRPHPPFDVTETNGYVLIEKILDASACPQLQVGDGLRTWNEQLLKTDHDVEFLTDFSSIGDSIRITYIHDSVTRVTDIKLIAAYGLNYVIIVLLVGIVAWGVGVFLFILRPVDHPARVLHLALVMMGVSVMITWGHTPQGSMWTYLSRTLFIGVYAGVAATFLHLTVLFPRLPVGASWVRGTLIYLPMSLLAVWMIYYHTHALREQSLVDFENFQTLFDIFHVAIVVYVGTGIVLFIRSYLRSVSSEERKKLKWILWGLTVGPLPFLLLTIIPQYYLPLGFVPEEYTLIFLAIIPITFGISFVKYHLLDIEVVINRTTVYGIVLAAVIVVYILLVGTVAIYVGTYTVGTSAVAAVLVALLFEPARRRVQHFVDKQFFRARYNFREALRRFADDMKTCVDAKQLADLLLARTEEIIPVERIGVFLLRQPDKRLFVLWHRGFDLLEGRSIPFEVEKLRTQLQLPVAVDARVEPGILYESADERVFNRWGMSLVFPMKSATGEFIGFFVLGEKKSRQRFSIEDVDLLSNVATQAGLEFERIALQRKLLEEQAENQRLEEMNQLKSDFVSNVSHELRTPLTSIKLYAEMLGGARPSDKKLRDYMKTIVGETDRLDRMVTNVLDSSKIERGVKQYHMRDTDLREIVAHVLASMKYQLDTHGFHVEYKEPKRRMPVHSDPDGVAEALMNLIANAIKFSSNKKYLKLSLSRKGDRVVCAVQDKGCGIPPAALPHIFERFYRDPASSASVQGVGLGLPLVKHIMDEHGGGVDVASTPGKGSTFILWFPVPRITDEKQKEHTGH